MPRNRRRKKKRSASNAIQRSGPAPLAVPEGQFVERPIDAKPIRSRQIAAFEHYQGLLPHPQHLERFEALHSGTTDRMLTLAEDQSAHRQRMERKFLNFNGASEILGVLFAGFTNLAGIAAGAFLIYNDKPVTGLVSMLGPLGLTAAIFFKTRTGQGKEIARKR